MDNKSCNKVKLGQTRFSLNLDKIKSKYILKFKTDKVMFLHSDHNKEEAFPKGSHLIQLVDVHIGAIIHCIHYEHRVNKGKNKAAGIIAPLVEEILNPKPRHECEHYTYRRYTISHFPVNALLDYNGEFFPGEFYKLKTVRILEANSPQIDLFENIT